MPLVATGPDGQCIEGERVREKKVGARVGHEATGESRSPDTAR